MTLLTYPKFQAPDINGVNLSGGLVNFYESGNSVRKDTYSDIALSVLNSNPVVLDARGEADIYLDGEYKVILETADGVEIWTKDPITGVASGDSIDTTNEGAMIFAGPTIWKETALADLKWDNTKKRFSIGVDASLEKAHLQDGTLLITPGTNAVKGTPTIEGSVVDATDLDGMIAVFALGNYIYTANFGDDSMRIIDVTDPANPAVVGGYKHSTNMNGARDIVCDGHYAYVSCNLNNSLRILDISDPTNPVVVGGIKDDTNLAGMLGIYLSGHYIFACCYTNNSLRIIDVSDPTSPVIYGAGLKDNTNLVGITDIHVKGGYAYVVCYTNNSIRIIDISNPAAPTMASGLQDGTTLEKASWIEVTGLHAYIITLDAIRILDVSDPTVTPIILGGTTSSFDTPRGLAVAGDYAYVTMDYDWGPGILVFDISDPTAPVIAARLDDNTFAGCFGVVLSGKYLYVADNTNDRLYVIDISGIKAPAATFGSLFSTILNVAANAFIANDAIIGGGLNVGRDVNIGGGLIADGLIGRQPTVASATALPLLGTNNSYIISGTNNITSITSVTSVKGREVTLIFQDILTFTDGNNLKLAGNFVTTADDAISLVCNGTNWYEKSRSAN